MKFFPFLAMTILSVAFLSGCQSTGSDVNTPSLSPNRAPTSRTPSPGNIRANNIMQSNTMTLPQ